MGSFKSKHREVRRNIPQRGSGVRYNSKYCGRRSEFTWSSSFVPMKVGDETHGYVLKQIGGEKFIAALTSTLGF